jgi:hypothetical protein
MTAMRSNHTYVLSAIDPASLSAIRSVSFRGRDAERLPPDADLWGALGSCNLAPGCCGAMLAARFPMACRGYYGDGADPFKVDLCKASPQALEIALAVRGSRRRPYLRPLHWCRVHGALLINCEREMLLAIENHLGIVTATLCHYS